ATTCGATETACRVRTAVECCSGIDTASALTGATARRTLSLEERIHRLDGEALERREPEAHDRRPVLTTNPAILEAGQLLLDLDVGQVEPCGWSEVQAERHAGEVTVGVHRQLVVGERAERLRAEAERVRNRNGQRELGVQPLDL